MRYTLYLLGCVVLAALGAVDVRPGAAPAWRPVLRCLRRRGEQCRAQGPMGSSILLLHPCASLYRAGDALPASIFPLWESALPSYIIP